MRGKQSSRIWLTTRRRIIPARAGQTTSHLVCGEMRPDHPRACGANQLNIQLDVWQSGSSPRVRGKRFRVSGRHVQPRIIPARAGQTSWRRTMRRHSQDHPRACGANETETTRPNRPPGSSPRVRGKLGVLQGSVQLVRIIPARAGQTRSTRSTEHATSDHPRACGANGSAQL